MRERNLRIALVVVDLFAAVSAFAGAVGLVVGYMNIPLSVLHGTSFVDFTVPALLLGIVVGGSALAAAAVAAAIAVFGPRRLTLMEPWRFDALASAAAGCIMVGWMTIEIALIGLGSWLQPVYFVVGLLMIGLAVLLQQAESRQSEQQTDVSVGARQHMTA